MAILNSAGSGTSRIGKPNLATLHFFSQIPGEAKFPLARRTVPEAAWRGDDVTVLLEKARVLWTQIVVSSFTHLAM
jgi:hypothetical protein